MVSQEIRPLFKKKQTKNQKKPGYEAAQKKVLSAHFLRAFQKWTQNYGIFFSSPFKKVSEVFPTQ